MGLWKEHFHWSVLLGWNVLSWAIPTLLGIGGLVIVFDQYAIANGCFIITAIFIFAKIAHVAINSDASVWNRMAFTFVIFGFVGVGIVELVRAVNHYRQQKEQIGLQSVKHEKTEPLLPKIIYENGTPYNDFSRVFDKNSKEISATRYVCIGLENNGPKLIEGVSVQMVSGPGVIEPKPFLPQNMRVRNRSYSVFDIPPGDRVIVEIVSKHVVWNGSGKEWLDAGFGLAFSEGVHKMPSGGYTLKLQILGREIPPQYIWLKVSDWSGKAEWKAERLPEGTKIQRMDGTVEIVSLRGIREPN